MQSVLSRLNRTRLGEFYLFFSDLQFLLQVTVHWHSFNQNLAYSTYIFKFQILFLQNIENLKKYLLLKVILKTEI